MGGEWKTFHVPAFSIPYSNLYLTGTLRLNSFQARIYHSLKKSENIILTAPTGSGKTLTLLLNTEHSIYPGKGALGFVALYPNNVLLANQMNTVEDLVMNHFGGELVSSTSLCDGNISESNRRSVRCIEPLRVYKVNKDMVRGASNPVWPDINYIALLALSGRSIISPDGTPKGEVVYRLAEHVLNFRREGVYVIVFATPDTYLLIKSGAYRNLEVVGKALHNILLARARGEKSKGLENILRVTGVVARERVSRLVGVSERLLSLPLFVDEFHLYNPYEVDALYAALELFKSLPDTENYPVVFSSATPADDILEDLGFKGRYERVDAQTVRGLKGFEVRGDTLITVIPVNVRGRGLAAYYAAASHLPDIVLEDLLAEIKSVKRGRALIILERLWMVAYLVQKLVDEDINVECIASIVPEGVCREGAPIIVGSEATTQGVNLGRVILGVTAGVSSEDVVQRIGRVGRRGVDSHIYLVLPERALEGAPSPEETDYTGLVEWVRRAYLNYPKRRRDISHLLPERYRDARRKLITTLGIVSTARVSGMTGLLSKIKLSADEARNLLESVVGPAGTMSRLILFRRTGFQVNYVVEGSGVEGSTSIGLITRNFRVAGRDSMGRLVIRLERDRKEINIVVHGDPETFRWRFVDLKILLELLQGTMFVGENVEVNPPGGSLAYVVKADEKLADYLSLSGEGAKIVSGGGETYVALFI
ncbi:MAG: DEAD/DEAH box helicase [Desulfurococcales archaeon]|nr:DEAD/DEAH box helicase [Desulfurococcales archaeon]